MLICKACGRENFSFRDSHISGLLIDEGSSVTVTEYCQYCGARIMEKCPICYHLHPLGVEYCSTTGKSITEALQERAERKRQKSKKKTYKELRFEISKKIHDRKISLLSIIAILLIAIFVGIGYLLNLAVGALVGIISAVIILYIIDWFIVEKPAKKEADKKITILYPEQT